MELNKTQKDAANKLDGNLLVISGAGTGKTTTIVQRYLNLIKSGIKPNEILVTTFTNKAAKDMIKKIENKTQLISPYIGTMHALFLKILRNHSKEAFNDEEYTLITEKSEQKKILREILKESDISTMADSVNYFLSWISKFKNRGILDENLSWEGGIDEAKKTGVITELIDDEIIHVDPTWRKKVNLVYKKYQKYLRENKLLDFDEILILTYRLLKENPEILKSYKDKFKAIMVDEAQDLNVVQINILEMLSKKNLCLIGDDCQNIYEWRGTSNDLVFKFQKTEENIYLNENYRSTKNIINSVNKVINSMENKIDKTLVSTRSNLKSVEIDGYYNLNEEIEGIINHIEELLENKEKPDDIAVLFRTNMIGKTIERAFRRREIPCELSKSLDFFGREEIMDTVSFLRLSINPYSKIDFSRLVSLIEGFGKVKIDKMIKFKEENDCSYIEALKNYPREELGKFITHKIEKLLNALESEELLEEFSENFGYRKYLENKYSKENERLTDKLENLSTLKELFEKHSKDPREFLDSLLDLEKREKSEGKVILSTIHGAKGLEWKNVFLAACNERILPFYKDELTKSKRDSELRLFYVAISRAKDNLVISYSNYSGYKRLYPSEFIQIISEEDFLGFKTF